MKKTAKKITAILTGATMLGATVMGAMALDLGDYPAPVIVDGVWDGKIVVGEHANAADTSGALKILAGLAEYSGQTVTVGGGVIIEGGYQDEFFLNQPFPADNLTLDKADLPSFFDGTIRWDGKNIKVKEVLTLVNESMEIRTNVNDDLNEDFGARPFLVLEKDSDEFIVYGFEFNDELNVTDIDKDVGRTAINLRFLGRDLKIIDHKDGDLTVESYTLADGSTGDIITTPEGYTITIGRITEKLVELTVNGQTKWVSEEDGAESFSAADWFEVEVDRIIYVDPAHPDNAVLLKYGEELDYVIEHGEPATLFGEPDRSTEAEWFWHVEYDASGDLLEFLGIINKMERTEYLTSPRATERSVIGVGESISLPEGYAEIAFEGFMSERYSELTIDFVRTSFVDVNNESNVWNGVRAIRLEVPDVSDAFQWGNEKENEIYLWDNSTHKFIGWDDGTDLVFGNYPAANISVKMNRRQDDITLKFADYGLWFEFELDDEEVEFLWFNVSSNGAEYHRYFGGETDTKAGHAWYNLTGSTNYEVLGGVDFDIMTSYGVVFEDPERQLGRDRVVLKIPHEELEAVVTVKTAGTTVGTGAGSTFVHVPIPIADVGVLDSEAMNLIGQVPMIVVGGPNANTVAAELLGVTPGSEEVLELFEPNKAMIKLFEEQQAILVAGYRAKDTVAASYILADFEANKASLVGHKEVAVAVPGTTVTTIEGK